MSDKSLLIKGLWHNYAKPECGQWTLKDIDFTLHSGELVGMLGPSGCGKTTLLRLIAGFETPSKGHIYINGEEIASSASIQPPERRRIGMVFQDYALFPHLSAWKNVCFGLKRGQDQSRALWLLELLGLENLRNRYPHELSGGQRQRLALARALAPGTSIVLLDEPFSNLDVEVRLRLRTELPAVLKSCGASGILVTHDPQEALAICDRVAVLRDGVLHQCAEPGELIHQPATPFVGRFVLQRNVLGINKKGKNYLTPLGSISIPSDPKAINANMLMIDEYSLTIKEDMQGHAVIQGREFLGSDWLFKVNLNGQILRVRQPIDFSLKPGDHCSLSFLPNSKGILFPGSIPCLL